MEGNENYDDLFDDNMFNLPPFTQVCSIRWFFYSDADPPPLTSSYHSSPITLPALTLELGFHPIKK